MSSWKEMAPAGLVVVVTIIILFIVSIILLFHVCSRYRSIVRKIDRKQSSNFLHCAGESFSAAYKEYGDEVNTPAIIENTVNTELGGLLFCERFLNNAVSLFVTLGLFGTFLGLSLSVSSLTQLIGDSNTTEWLNVLDSVGGGLMSALSGMGVAFYTSLVGVACSIILTILRAIFSPQSEREAMMTATELWLDHTVAPQLPTNAAKDDATLVRRMIEALDRSTTGMSNALSSTTEELKRTLVQEKEMLEGFNKTVSTFNEGVHDFSEVDYNLRGTVERMDVGIRDFTGLLRRASRSAERTDGQ